MLMTTVVLVTTTVSNNQDTLGDQQNSIQLQHADRAFSCHG